jgi:histidine phosphotransferase ChpT
MSEPPSTLDLAALIASRICHDLISPVGAIINGLEVLDEDEDGEMREVALDLVRKSARTASARLQFCRLAFGFAGSAGATVDLADAERVARAYVDGDRAQLDWKVPPGYAPKDRVKLSLTLVALSQQAIPRGGNIVLAATGAELDGFAVTATGTHARIPAGLDRLLAGETETPLDAHAAVGFYAGLLARSAGLAVSIAKDGDTVRFTAA